MLAGIKKFARFSLALLGPIPYKITFWTVLGFQKLLVPQGKLSVRNSFRLGYYQPGYSDLDLSLYLAVDNTTLQEIRFEKTYRILRKFNPLLGEMNYYRPRQLEFIQRQHNFLELSRNPDLSAARPANLLE